MSDEATVRKAERLIGGWVAGTLTDSERKLLLEASLHNQALFDALADEEGLRELMADPAVRRELAAVLNSKTASEQRWWQRLLRPAPMAAFGVAAMALIGVFVVSSRTARLVRAPVIVAENRTPNESALPARVPEPRPVEAIRRQDPRRLPSATTPPSAAMSRRDEPSKDSSAPAVAKEREELAEAGGRASRVAEAGPPTTEPTAVAPAAPPPPAPKAESVTIQATPPAVSADEKKASAPVPPIRYRVERLQPGGQWVEFGGELSSGAQARVAVEATQAGVVLLRSGNEVVNAAVRAGETVYFPPSGSLPAEAGEREVAILFSPGQLQSFAAPLQSYRAKAAAPAPAPPAGGARQRESRTADAVQQVNAPNYSVTVRLRYR